MIKYILCDIEGTTTSVSFVYDVLFPYFQEKIEDFVKENLEVEFVRKNIEKVKQSILVEQKKEIDDNDAIKQLVHWTKTDRKHTALKALQGYVWKKGYEQGEIKGHLYSDVKPNLQKWVEKGIQLGIYSSGSVQAQKLLFSTSVYGNLSYLFSNHFDTNIGNKKEASSYQNIQQELEIKPQNILFLSDVEAELDVAQTANFKTIQLLREDTKASVKHKTTQSFWEVSDFLDKI